MSVVYLILPLAMILAIGAVWFFIAAARKGQFDDLETPAMRVLFDDEDEAVTPQTKPASPEGDAGAKSD